VIRCGRQDSLIQVSCLDTLRKETTLTTGRGWEDNTRIYKFSRVGTAGTWVGLIWLTTVTGGR